MNGTSDPLIEDAFRQTLARFQDEVARGVRDPRKEREQYRRRRRDYASSLRMDRIPDEARELASRLLETHGRAPDPSARTDFERDVTKLLIRLYDAFLDSTGTSSQGSR